MLGKKLVIIGTGGHSRIVIDIAIQLRYKIQGVIDLNYRKNKKEKIFGHNVIGGLETLSSVEYKDCKIFLAIGDIKLRAKLYNNLCKKFKFANLIDKKSIVSSFAKIGNGVLICPLSVINASAIIEDNTIINTNSVIEHETIIGKNSNISPGVIVGGRTIIGDNSFIGLGTKIINSVKIGKNSIIGAGSLVIKNIPNNSKVFGVPAKKIK